jgi:hypothetical protein
MTTYPYLHAEPTAVSLKFGTKVFANWYTVEDGLLLVTNLLRCHQGRLDRHVVCVGYDASHKVVSRYCFMPAALFNPCANEPEDFRQVMYAWRMQQRGWSVIPLATHNQAFVRITDEVAALVRISDLRMSRQCQSSVQKVEVMLSLAAIVRQV